MTYTEAVAYLESLIDYERSPAGAAAARLWNLDRMRGLLRAVGDPHLALRTLHIAGTKGKGSTAAMTAYILTAAGLRTGLYTSPHLVSFQERIRVDGQPIPEADVVALTERVRPLIEEAKGSEFGPPSFFEAYTLMAFLHFAQAKVECAVIETGLGGRLDATNVIMPLGCAITRLGYDHMQELGGSLAEIAREKAGIIKPGLSAISAPQATEALEVLQDVCLERHAQLLVVGDDGPRVRVTAYDQQRMEMVIEGRLGRYAGLQTPLVGAHQAENAAVAVGLVELLEPHGLRISPAAIAEGLASVRWPGRFQIVRRRPTVVLDGAHDEAAAEVLAATLSALYPGRRILLVLGVHRDKDAEAIAAHLCPLADRVIATASSSPRAVEARELQRMIFRRCRHTSAYTPVSLAVQEALDHARTDDIVVITGSLYVVGEAMRALGVQVAEQANDGRRVPGGRRRAIRGGPQPRSGWRRSGIVPEVPSAVQNVADELYKCNRCGFCQTRCPVYRLTGKEASVARGHSARLRAVLEGELPLDGALRGSISECLMCRACTAECPPAIETDRIIVAARTAYTARRQAPLQRFIFRQVLARRGLLGLGARGFRLLKRTGLASAVSLLRYLPWGRGLASAPQLMPTPASFLRDRVPTEARAKAARVTYFVGCAIEFALPEVGEATLQVLRAAGMSARLGDNVCCGLPPYSYGDVAAATTLARRNLEALAGEEVLLTDCGSCSSFLKEYPQLFAEESPERGRAESLSGRVRDATEFLLDLDLPELLPVPAVVTYHDPCHLSRYQKLAPQARALLARIPGLDYRELPEADWCCGGAGSYGVTHPETSRQILQRKMENVRGTGASLLVTACPACMLQLRYGATLFEVPVEVVHISQLLARALPPVR